MNLFCYLLLAAYNIGKLKGSVDSSCPYLAATSIENSMKNPLLKLVKTTL
jgi:hypothetical protein